MDINSFTRIATNYYVKSFQEAKLTLKQSTVMKIVKSYKKNYPADAFSNFNLDI